MMTAHVIDRPGLVIYYQGQDQLNQKLQCGPQVWGMI